MKRSHFTYLFCFAEKWLASKESQGDFDNLTNSNPTFVGRIFVLYTLNFYHALHFLVQTRIPCLSVTRNYGMIPVPGLLVIPRKKLSQHQAFVQEIFADSLDTRGRWPG